MDNVFWLLQGKLAGRPGPAKVPWDLAELRRTFDVMLNISEHPSATEELDRLRFEHRWIPLPETVPADEEAEERCLRLLPEAEQYLCEQLDSGRRVLVHCVSGKDRTGMLFAYHLARLDGMDAVAALDRVRRVRPQALSAGGWEAMALRVMRRLEASEE